MATQTTHEDSLAEQSDDAAELATFVAASHGETVMGEVTNVEKYQHDDEWVVTVWLPHDRTIQRHFEYPKPPFESYELTRLSRAYGNGLVDIEALEGEQIPCRYDEDTWRIEVPDRPKHDQIVDVGCRIGEWTLLPLVLLWMFPSRVRDGTHIDHLFDYLLVGALAMAFWGMGLVLGTVAGGLLFGLL